MIDAHKVNQAVGQRVRMLRMARGMSQVELAKKIGISFQQLQKYESGSNRLTVGRLMQLVEVLNVPVQHFFSADKLPDNPQSSDLMTSWMRSYAIMPEAIRIKATKILRILAS